MTALQFPADTAVAEVWWEDDPESGRWGHLLAIGVVQVPDGTPVRLSVDLVVEVSVSNRRGGGWTAPVGTPPPPPVPPHQVRERVTWNRNIPDRAARNTSNIWGETDEVSYSIETAYEDVDLEFLSALPPDSVSELELILIWLGSEWAGVRHPKPADRQLIDPNLNDSVQNVARTELLSRHRIRPVGLRETAEPVQTKRQAE